MTAYVEMLAWQTGLAVVKITARPHARVTDWRQTKDCWAITMLPTREQIERAAYDRWLRRDRAHGHDRDDWVGAEQELVYLLNYETVVEYPLAATSPVTIGADARPLPLLRADQPSHHVLRCRGRSSRA